MSGSQRRVQGFTYLNLRTQQGRTPLPSPATGNIGIGTASPDANLTIVGSMGLWSDSQYHGNTNTLSVPDATTGNSYYSGAIVFSPQYYDGSTFSFPERMRITSSGNVGIGTTTPQAPLDVAGTQIQLYDPSQGAANYSYLKTSAYTNNTQKLTLGTTFGYNTPVDALTIWDGNVGIGTTSPAYNLDVTGQIRATTGYVFPDGTTQTTAFIPANCGADYAESVGVTGDRTSFTPGDLLVIDPNNPGSFLKSNQPYSTLIAGVYSTKPGFVGRLEPASAKTDATEVPMAMVGRVPAKVSAENGPIKVGDLLVSSSTVGYAMKGTDRSLLTGAVIGKALGSLDSGTGTILVLVTLQ